MIVVAVSFPPDEVDHAGGSAGMAAGGQLRAGTGMRSSRATNPSIIWRLSQGPADRERTAVKVGYRELEARLANTEKQLESLRSEVRGNHIAFGAYIGNSGTFGPFNTHVTLVYKNVYFHSGSYNSATGIFTAPVREVYYFSFSGHNSSSKGMGLYLMKNGEHMVMVYNHPAGNRPETATNGMTLQLEVGDHVYMRLFTNSWIFDNTNKHSTFIGHLLFPL
ncbi:complement C1q-like protein 4 [Pholidichthys leucotaenia]